MTCRIRCYNTPMEKRGPKVVVAMSGGVDSSVAACLLHEQGYEVMGLFMRTGTKVPEDTAPEPAACSAADAATESDAVAASESAPQSAQVRPHQGCCSASDASDARFVAGMLGVPFYSLNFERDFDKLIDYFSDEYVRGRTPNPCIVCNDKLKFGKIVEYADAVGAEFIATGHYARLADRDGRRMLLRGVDHGKDQSYVLFGLDRSILDRLIFPIGDLPKSEVRALAKRFDLPNQNKPDSVEICFVPDNDYARVVRERRPEAFTEGDVVDGEGKVLGKHQGVANFTVGQRRGLGIAAGKPIYVTELDVLNNTVVMGEADALMHDALIADGANFFIESPTEPFRAQVKIRYLHPPSPAMVHPLEDGRVRVEFDETQRAITPGQAVVFYDGDVTLGGAWIERAKSGAVASHGKDGASGTHTTSLTAKRIAE